MAFLCVLLAAAGPLTAQITFHCIPDHLQMFPRGAANTGTFLVDGECATPGVAAIRTELREQLRDSALQGPLVESFEQELGADRRFTVTHSVPAKLSEYSLLFYEITASGDWNLVRKVKDLVAGDFYLIAGQSNAEANADGPVGEQYDRTYAHPACRAIGASFHWATSPDEKTGKPRLTMEEDSRMGRPSSMMNAHGDKGFVNAWGLELQYNMAVKSGIPSCFVNAARGGLSIFECLPSSIPSDESRLRHSPLADQAALPYDRCYKKLLNNHAEGAVRAVFWYQGETDGVYAADSAAAYEKKFSRLYDAWSADHPSLEKVFVLQVSMGCGGQSLRLVADIQRKLTQKHKKVAVMSTVGFDINERREDRCHYTVEGWKRLAENLFPLAYTALYGNGDLFPHLPADVIRAYYITPTRIGIRFNKKVSIDEFTVYHGEDSGTVFAADNFFSSGDTPVNVLSVEAVLDELHLTLSDTQKEITDITFLPGSYTRIPTLYAGPWIRNGDIPDIGALVFYRLPVEPLRMVAETSDRSPGFGVLPVPATDHCWVIFDKPSDHTVTVHDMYGVTIGSFSTENETRVRVDLSRHPAGVYFLRSGGGNYFSRIVRID